MVPYYSSPRKLICYQLPLISESKVLYISLKGNHWIIGHSTISNAQFSISLDADQWMLLTTNFCKIFVYLKSFYSARQVGRTVKLCLLLKAYFFLFVFCGFIAYFIFKRNENKIKRNESKQSFISISGSLSLSKYKNTICESYIF